MNLDLFTGRLTSNAESIRSMIEGISDEQAGWKPDPDSWSILEVVNHLYDEEKEDFRVRLDIILHQPDQPWPAIDPSGWVVERQYNQRELPESLDNFLHERQASIRWLNQLTSPYWQATYEAPFGKITAGDMFTSWVAHDLLHMRQLVELHWAYLVNLSKPFKPDYAGTW
jgi:hypothetical protein